MYPTKQTLSSASKKPMKPAKRHVAWADKKNVMLVHKEEPFLNFPEIALLSTQDTPFEADDVADPVVCALCVTNDPREHTNCGFAPRIVAKADGPSWGWHKLPGEVRNKIYDLIYQEPMDVEIQWLKKHKYLTYWQYRIPRLQLNSTTTWGTREPSLLRARIWGRVFRKPDVDYDTIIRRDAILYPRRVRQFPHLKVQDPPGPAALLLTCRSINEEATKLFYGNCSFGFTSCHLMAKFLSQVGERAKGSITRVFIDHNNYVQSKWMYHADMKSKNDETWLKVCQNAADELTALKDLRVLLRVYDESSLDFPHSVRWPSWVKPLLAFRGRKLTEADVVLFCEEECSIGQSCGKLDRFARAIRKELLGAEYRGERTKFIPA